MIRTESHVLTPPAAKYECDVVSEAGLRVFFSNQGLKIHKNPVLRPNEGKQDMKCLVAGCNARTKRVLGLCRLHAMDEDIARRHRLKDHTADWYGCLLRDNEPNDLALGRVPEHMQMVEWMLSWAGDDARRSAVLDEFIPAVAVTFAGKAPDATALLSALEGATTKVPPPDALVAQVRLLTEEHFPRPSSGELLAVSFRGEQLHLPLRLLASLFGIGLLCEEVNRGDAWRRQLMGKGDPHRAGCWMPVAYFLMRRHTPATEQQARRCVSR
jgi:hypothetical protein